MLDECVVERARFVVVTQRTTFNEHAVNIDKIKNQHRERYETNMITLDQRPRIETLLASSRVYTTTIEMRRVSEKEHNRKTSVPMMSDHDGGGGARQPLCLLSITHRHTHIHTTDTPNTVLPF